MTKIMEDEQMPVLICGGAGYIGSHTNKLLNERGYKTIVFDNLVYGHREAVKQGNFVYGDLKNMEDIEGVFQKYRIESVIHLAAYAYVGESVRNPEKYYYNNIYSTLNLLHVMKKYGCQNIIFSSTCSTYGELSKMPVTEEMPQNPVNPYGRTKLAVEHIFEDYAKAYGLHYVIFRYFNAAGADPQGELGESHEPETHLIPLILDAAGGKRESIEVYGTDYDTEDGTCIRDYIHVMDLAEAHWLAMDYLRRGGNNGCYNLGNEKGYSVLEVISTVKKITGKEFTVKYTDRRPGDPPILIGSSKKAKDILGWRPKYGQIDTIVKHAWTWHEDKKF